MVSHKREELIKSIAEEPAIEADFMVGLTSAQVEQRIKDGFNNRIPKKVTKSFWQIFCDNFFSFFNLVFFAIAVLMLFAQLDWTYFFFLLPIVCNIIIGLVADIHARVLVDKLRLVTDPKVNVMRDGKELSLGVDEVVLSDIMVLHSGDQICADGVIVNGTLKLDESLVTGESEAIHKMTGDQILSGTFVVAGKAYVRVNRVGLANYAEGLQDSAKNFERPYSELKESCLKIFWTSGVTAIVLFLAMLLTWIITTKARGLDLDFASYRGFIRSTSGSLEAMIPAGLYLLTSLTLAIGIINLAKRRMNVQELYSIEMLARVDTICFDKTGTLTDGVLSIKEFYNFSDFTDAELQGLLSGLLVGTGDSNGTATALKKAYPHPTHNAVCSIPFDSERKYSAASFAGMGTLALGAPGFVSALPNAIADARASQLASRGYRVVGLYWSKKMIANNDIPAKMAFIGLLSLSDHVKADAKPTIDWFRSNGVGIKIISGDNPVTVSEIANEVGVPGAVNYISLENIKDEDIPSLADRYTVFGRVKPEQKALLVSALQEEGHKVAMTGDGVNDILALKKADCSIAMASGSSAARNVAHLVSLDNDFSKLPDVVAEGRRVINNLQRTASLFLSKTVFAIIVTIAFLVVSWATGRGYSYPFTTKNMLVWEMVTIGGGGLFLSLQPSKERLQGSYLANVLVKAVPAGISEILLVGVFYITAAIFPSFMSADAAKGLSVIGFTAISYLVLFRISLPFDTYRTTVFCSLLIVGAAFFAIDGYFSVNYPNNHLAHLFGINYQALGPQQILMSVILFVCLCAVYVLLDWASRKIAKKCGLKKAGGK